MRFGIALALAVMCAAASAPAQEDLADTARGKAFDQILDLYVRDGYVYYRALKADRAKLDGYLGQISAEPVDKLPRAGQIAFWLNAYNALVLRTVIDRYPIPQRTTEYPLHSIRQIPGAFER